MDDVNKPEIIRGITKFDEGVHVSTGQYRSLGEDVEVVEIDHSGLLPHLGERWPVFTRMISEELFNARKIAFKKDPKLYKLDHLKNL
jgi:hypothetical protein